MRSVTPLFKADWLSAVFIHFAVDHKRLQPLIPFELDTWEGTAFVSLVAFAQSRLRPARGGRIAEWLSTPLACHEFLNLRTYVRRGNDRGIYFLSEWIPNRLAVLIGPRTYGLPYRLARLDYRTDLTRGTVAGRIKAGTQRLQYQGRFDPNRDSHSALDGFLIERYVALTRLGDITRLFRIDHSPWPLLPARIELVDTSLLEGILPGLVPICGHFSPGVRDVLIGAPEKQTYDRESDTLMVSSQRGAATYVQSLR